MVNCKRKLKPADHFKNLLDYAKGTKNFNASLQNCVGYWPPSLFPWNWSRPSRCNDIYKETEQPLSSAGMLPKIIDANFMTSQVLDLPWQQRPITCSLLTSSGQWKLYLRQVKEKMALWRQYPINIIKICNLRKDVVAKKNFATVGLGRLVFINKSHHLGVFDQCCHNL